MPANPVITPKIFYTSFTPSNQGDRTEICSALLAATLRRTSRSCRLSWPALRWALERLRLRVHCVAEAVLAVDDEEGPTSSADTILEELVDGTVQSVVRAVVAMRGSVASEEGEGAVEEAERVEEVADAVEVVELDEMVDDEGDVEVDELVELDAPEELAPGPTQLVPVKPAGVVGLVLA